MSNKDKKVIKTNIQDWLRQRDERNRRRAAGKLNLFNPLPLPIRRQT